jgi:hypothetical protein
MIMQSNCVKASTSRMRRAKIYQYLYKHPGGWNAGQQPYAPYTTREATSGCVLGAIVSRRVRGAIVCLLTRPYSLLFIVLLQPQTQDPWQPPAPLKASAALLISFLLGSPTSSPLRSVRLHSGIFSNQYVSIPSWPHPAAAHAY